MTDTSIMPSGPRPVPIALSRKYDEVQSGWTCNEYRDWTQVERQWVRGYSAYGNPELRNGSRTISPMYETEADAWLELEWRYFDQWQEKAKVARREREKAMGRSKQAQGERT